MINMTEQVVSTLLPDDIAEGFSVQQSTGCHSADHCKEQSQLQFFNQEGEICGTLKSYTL